MTQAVAPTGLDPHWQTRLFSSDGVCRASADQERLSPRAAYQQLLYGRAVLLDIRPFAERASQGEIHPELRPVIAEHRLPEPVDAPVIVLCQDGRSSLVTAELMRGSRQAQVTDIEGGFHAWRDLGLPTA